MESVGANRKEGAASRHPPVAFLVLDSLREGDVVVFPGGRQFLAILLYVCRLATVEAVRIMVIIVDFIVDRICINNKKSVV